ncbi:MAG: hypothetical protein ABSA32_10370 [Candidatus Acidiferrales bacterium]
MSFGFNTNVRVGDVVYHVQTEQRSSEAGALDTVVYILGRVVHRVHTKLQDGGEHEKSPQDLRERVLRHHQAVVAQVESGAVRAEVAAAPRRSVPRAAATAATAAAPSAATASAAATAPAALTIRPLNPGAWLKRTVPEAPGRPTTASITVEILLAGGAPAAGATLEARIEWDGVVSAIASASADAAGKAALELPVHRTLPESAVLVLRANTGELRAELRFRMKPKPAGSRNASAR